MSKTTPTQRTLKKLKEEGYHAAVTEKWNPFAGIRQDLWNFADLIAFKPGEPVLLVQTTSKSNVSAREKKIKENGIAAAWVKAGNRIDVHGWGKNKKGRWEVSVRPVTTFAN